MRVFSSAELRYLHATHDLARLATVDPGGIPHARTLPTGQVEGTDPTIAGARP